jgi:hypothetical protein
MGSPANSPGRPVPRGPDRYTRPIVTTRSRLLLAVACTAAIVGCSDDPDPDRPTAESVLQVSDRTCLLVEGPLDPEVSELPVIDCDRPHTHEIYDRVRDDEHDVYPGFAELEQFAQLACYSSFEDYVGVNPFDSALFVSWLVPTLDGWNDKNDREILCVAGRRDGGQLDVSIEGTQL